MEEELKLYSNRVKRLLQLLRDYEDYLTKWDGTNLVIYERRDDMDPNRTIPTFTIEFYKYTVQPGYDKQPMAYRQSTDRTFDFTLPELDKAIDRYRKKIEYEKLKITTDESNT